MKYTLAFLIVASTAILVASMRSSGVGSSGAAKKRPRQIFTRSANGQLVPVPGNQLITGRQYLSMENGDLVLVPDHEEIRPGKEYIPPPGAANERKLFETECGQLVDAGPSNNQLINRQTLSERISEAKLEAILARWECAKWECNAEQRPGLTREAIVDKWKCTQDEFEIIVAELENMKLMRAGPVRLVNDRNLLCILFHDNQDEFKEVLARANIPIENDDPKTIRDKILGLQFSDIGDVFNKAFKKGLTIKSFD